MEYKWSHGAAMSTALKYLFKKCCLAAEMILFVFHVDFCDVGFYDRNGMTHILLPEMEVKPFFSQGFYKDIFKIPWNFGDWCIVLRRQTRNRKRILLY